MAAETSITARDVRAARRIRATREAREWSPLARVRLRSQFSASCGLTAAMLSSVAAGVSAPFLACGSTCDHGSITEVDQTPATFPGRRPR